jgi:hypothetical protein
MLYMWLNKGGDISSTDYFFAKYLRVNGLYNSVNMWKTDITMSIRIIWSI